MGKPPQATFDTEPSGKTKSAKRKKQRLEVFLSQHSRRWEDVKRVKETKRRTEPTEYNKGRKKSKGEVRRW